MDRIKKIDIAIKEQAEKLRKIEAFLRVYREEEDKIRRGVGVLESMKQDLTTKGRFQEPNGHFKESIMAKLERRK